MIVAAARIEDGYQYVVVDVFTTKPLAGNAAAVILDADSLDGVTMQAIAREMNLSETVFLMQPRDARADYRVRIFTPRSELPFAGHPTLAAAHCHLRAGGQGASTVRKLVQECELGLIEVEVQRDGKEPRLTMEQPRACFQDVSFSPSEAASLLGLDPGVLASWPIQIVSTGVRWLLVPLFTSSAISLVKPNLTKIADASRILGTDGIVTFAVDPVDTTRSVRLRTFAPVQGIAEDPVCGSGNGAVGAYIAQHRLMGPPPIRYCASQGAELGRAGTVYVEVTEHAGELIARVGGQVVEVAEGRLLSLPATASGSLIS